jgi:hypothetical protein
MATMPTHIAGRLVATVAGLVDTDVNRNLFYQGIFPPQPAIAVFLMETMPRGLEMAMKGGGTGVVCERPGLLVKIRHSSHVLGDALAQSCFLSLNNFVGELSGVRYLHILAAHNKVYLGVDEDKRHLFSINFGIRKEIG